MMKKNYAMLAAMLMCLNSVAVSAPVNKAMAVSEISDKTADDFMKMLSLRHTINDPIDEWRIKPAEFSEDGTLPYVSLMHLQDLDGLLIRCTDEAALDEIAGNRKITALDSFIEVSNLINEAEGKTRNENRDQLLAEYRNEDIYVVEFCFGVFPSKEKQYLIVQSIIDNPKLELLGMLQTDWYIKGYYDEMNTGLYIVPEEGFEISSDDLNTEAYHYLDYKPKLSDYQLSYIRDLPDNTGYATITKDNMEFEEVEALCDALEAREDIAYAWIAPVYLNDKLSNPGDFGYSINLFEANTPEITDPEYPETTTEITVFADYTDMTTITTVNGSIPEAVWGDIDVNSSINVLDAVLLARLVADDSTLKEDEITKQGKLNTDVTHDETTDSADLSKLLNCLSGKITNTDLAKA